MQEYAAVNGTLDIPFRLHRDETLHAALCSTCKNRYIQIRLDAILKSTTNIKSSVHLYSAVHTWFALLVASQTIWKRCLLTCTAVLNKKIQQKKSFYSSTGKRNVYIHTFKCKNPSAVMRARSSPRRLWWHESLNMSDVIGVFRAPQMMS